MAMEEIKRMETFRAAQAEVYRGWQDVEDAVLKLQNAIDGARQSLSKVAPQLAHDPEGWRALDSLSYFEELTLDAGRVVDEVKRKLDVPARTKRKARRDEDRAGRPETR